MTSKRAFLLTVFGLLWIPVMSQNRYWVGTSTYQCTFSSISELDEWQTVENNGTGNWSLSGNGTAILEMDNLAGGYAVRLFNDNGSPMIFSLDAINGVVEFEIVALTGGDQRFFLQVEEYDAGMSYITEQTIFPETSTTGYHSLDLSTVTWDASTANIRFIFGGENFSSQQGTIEINYFSYSSADKSWNNTANWSTTSGGTGGASAPGASNTAIFDGGSGTHHGICYITAPVTVSTITVSGYTGVIDLRGNTLTTTSGSTLSTGQITDSNGSGSISMNTSGTLTFSGTTFNTSVDVTAGTIALNGSIFNKSATITNTGAGTSTSNGGNIFNAATVLRNNGLGTFQLAGTNGDTYNDTVTFRQSLGIIQPAYSGTNTFEGGITVTGSVAVTFGSNGGVVTMGGSNDQTINRTGSASPNIRRLTMNKTSGSVTLNTQVNIPVTVTLTNGVINTTSGNYLNIEDNATATGASNNSYVDGPVRKTGNDAFTFPVGDGGVYRSLSISAPTFITDAFTAQYFKQQQAYGSSIEGTLSTASACEYWTLDRNAGLSNVLVTLSWVSAECSSSYVTDASTMRVAHWTGTLWENLGGASITGDGVSGTVTTSSAVTSYSPFTLTSTSSSNPLPVELSRFRATEQGNTVWMHWTTSTEINNDFFTVERSANGLDFEGIGRVDGAGTSYHDRNYTFTDDGPYPGRSYYRLKQTDIDGKFSYSSVEIVDRPGNDLPLIIHPNPARTNEEILLNQKATIEIFDPLGRLIERIEKTDRIRNSFPPGTYILRNQEGETARLVIY